jgi:hypothetical protein
MSKPALTTYSDDRLATYHLFTLRMSHSDGNTRGERNGRMAWRREAQRVEREVNARMEIA